MLVLGATLLLAACSTKTETQTPAPASEPAPAAKESVKVKVDEGKVGCGIREAEVKLDPGQLSPSFGIAKTHLL